MSTTDKETNKKLEVILSQHIGHKISALKAGDTMLELKCLDCNKVLGYNWDIVKESEEAR